MPTTNDKNTRTISPRVDGKRPRIKPRALDVDEHVRQVHTAVIINPGSDGSAVLPKKEDHQEP